LWRTSPLISTGFFAVCFRVCFVGLLALRLCFVVFFVAFVLFFVAAMVSSPSGLDARYWYGGRLMILKAYPLVTPRIVAIFE
jgi:hypothetical protein